ncbi:hypothetical protein AWB75_07208 [Caballeronia catudaia]|uniref:Uncharacterized protein n=1 Tax=Caballeronia catudaia TaxID=1777136 RepID=A0A158DVX0_9BURK|nr:hypothetical protein AWB75_07208 [Caballeronia catudaia]
MIVEAQPVDHLVHRFATCCKALAKDASALERSPQTLGRRVVPAIASTAHRTAHAVGFEQVLEVTTAILATPVAMDDQARFRLAAKPRHTQRVRHQLRAHVRLHRPAHHLTAKQVEDDRQVQPAVVSPEVRDVRSPGLIGASGREVALQQVRRDRQVVVAVGGRPEAAFGLRLDAVQLHELLDAILADSNALGKQLLPHARPAIPPLDSACTALMCTSRVSLLMHRRGRSVSTSRALRAW